MVTESIYNDGLQFADTSDVYQDRMAQLHHFRKNRTFCDVVLQVENTEIYAHRSVLACASRYFLELFTEDDENKTASEDKLIYKLNGGFELESVEKLVTYAYTGEISVPSSMVKSVFIAANKLKMENIVKACGNFLVQTLTPETCLSIRALPRIAETRDLVEQIDQYIQEQTDLLEVTKEAMVSKVLLKVIHASTDEASITLRALCSLALDWIRKEIEQEEITIETLTEKEHLLYLNLDNSLHDCSDIEAGAANDSKIVQDYRKISRKSSHSSIKVPRRKLQTPMQPAKPRMMLFSRSISDKDDEVQDTDWKLIAFSKPIDNSVIAVVTLGGPVAVLSIQQHLDMPPAEPQQNGSRPPSVEKVDSYTLVSHMKSPRCASGTGTFLGQLLVCGGYDREECLKEVELYNPANNTWSTLPNMQQNRGRFDLTVVDNKAYAVGGSNGCKELSSVEVLDLDEAHWSFVASLPRARSNAAVCSADKKVFCIGGWNGQTGIKQCDVYDPKTKQWSTIAPLHIGRYQAAAVSMNGKVYVVGGCDSWNCLNSLEVYDPLKNSWRNLAPMNTPRRGCGAASLNGKIYVMGGSDGSHSLCSTEIYDVETNTWSAGPSMTSMRANVGATVIGKRIYCVGGFSGKNFLNSIEFLCPKTQEWTNFTPKPEYLVKQEDCLLREEFSDEEIQHIKNPEFYSITDKLVVQDA